MNNVVDWSSGVTVFSNKAFALQYTTTASKTVECCFFICVKVNNCVCLHDVDAIDRYSEPKINQYHSYAKHQN